jgi:hypothetical protein
MQAVFKTAPLAALVPLIGPSESMLTRYARNSPTGPQLSMLAFGNLLTPPVPSVAGAKPRDTIEGRQT